MKRAYLLLLVLLMLLLFSLSAGVMAQPAPAAPPPLVPAFGLGVSLPILTISSLTTALTYINTWVEAPLTLDMAARLGLRLYLSTTGFRADLTTMDSTLLIFLNRGMARFYIGGGFGAFPYEAFTAPAPISQSYGLGGTLFALHHVAGFRVTAGPFSIFVELRYELMPQSICLLDSNGDGTYDGVCDGFGALSSFQLTIGGMMSFGSAACIPSCSSSSGP